MPESRDFNRRHGGRDAEDVGLEAVLVCTQALYKSRKTLTETCFNEAMIMCKRIALRTAESEHVRNAIGGKFQHWKDMCEVFVLAIPVLEAQSLAREDAVTGDLAPTSALITQHYDTLMKDLERLNDLLLLARNILATTQAVQLLASESRLDQQVTSLIDLCIRVTARGYDGEPDARAEQQWANVINSYKKLLITCLQFLYNFVQDNEQRKLLLWLDLFANSKVASEYNAGNLPPGLGRDHFVARFGEINSQDEMPSALPCRTLEKSAELMEKSEARDESCDQTSNDQEHGEESDDNSLRREIDEITDSVDCMKQMSVSHGQNRTNGEENDREATIAYAGASASQSIEEICEPSPAHTQKELLFGAVTTERGDEFGVLRTPQSAAITLQQAKDQLMARLTESDPVPTTVTEDGQEVRVTEGLGEIDYQPPSDEEEGYRSPGEPGDQERGLLTDIPLVLGPQEIEALPMLIQIGICGGQGEVMCGRDMQTMRCNILLAGESGRNLLRELLIFIAAWDLQDDETYFKLMMQIMEAILENGLMPYAYQTFAEVKDIVSPAQSMVIKILTQIFRGKQSLPPVTEKAAWTTGNVHADASRRVDIYIVRYIFTIFRQCIIPETCALIYLQGQIKAGHALPEDFPLNLWDMERVYEGVYQFLEFFAVLTESDEWKDLLVNWEIVSELVTLLRELEASIPKSTATSIPQTVTEAQQTAATPQTPQPIPPVSSAPTPVVERPFDIPPGPALGDNTFPVPSPLSQADSQDPDTIDAAESSDFEWRNLKKLVILVLSSLVWKSPTVQKQIRQYGGVEMVLACCNYDGNNPYIKEHAVMCLRFLLEGSEENKALVKGMEEARIRSGGDVRGVGRLGRLEGTGQVVELEESL